MGHKEEIHDMACILPHIKGLVESMRDELKTELSVSTKCIYPEMAAGNIEKSHVKVMDTLSKFDRRMSSMLKGHKMLAQEFAEQLVKAQLVIDRMHTFMCVLNERVDTRLKDLEENQHVVPMPESIPAGQTPIDSHETVKVEGEPPEEVDRRFIIKKAIQEHHLISYTELMKITRIPSTTLSRKLKQLSKDNEISKDVVGRYKIFGPEDAFNNM